MRATLAGGVAFGVPWGIGLDGLVASALWHQAREPDRTMRALEAPVPPDLDLPLARCRPVDGPWHWAATCFQVLGAAGALQVHHSLGRVDQRATAAAAASLPEHLEVERGRWRNRWAPHLVTIAHHLQWQGVGDVDAITGLLAGVDAIGKRRAAGEGQVLAWSVEEAGDLDVVAAAHCHADGSLGRPVPWACWVGVGRPAHTGPGTAAIHPPAMHPQRMHSLYLPAAV